MVPVVEYIGVREGCHSAIFELEATKIWLKEDAVGSSSGSTAQPRSCRRFAKGYTGLDMQT